MNNNKYPSEFSLTMLLFVTGKFTHHGLIGVISCTFLSIARLCLIIIDSAIQLFCWVVVFFVGFLQFVLIFQRRAKFDMVPPEEYIMST